MNRKQYTDPDSLPQWEAIGRDGTKWFSDLLGPLRKYLRRQVGRPWDKVYSEITEHLRPTSITHRHILDHLWRELTVDVEERDGHLVSNGHPWRFRPRRDAFYVCPRTKLLRIFTGCRRSCCRRKSTKHLVREGLEYRFIRGCWYEVTLSRIPSEQKAPNAFDAVLGRYLYRRPRVLMAELATVHNAVGVYAVARRKLTRSERIAAGLRPNESGQLKS